MKTCLLDLDRADLETVCARLDARRFRAAQVWTWIHGKQASSWEAMTNLPQAFRTGLADHHALWTLTELDHRTSCDGLTEKWLFQGREGSRPEHHQHGVSDTPAPSPQPPPSPPALIETVLIREQHLARATVCVSSMVGCPLGCTFCATGRHGFVRDLTRGEILEQVYRVAARSAPERGVTNVVFMGMGEPLLNLEPVLGAARVLADPEGLGLSGRHITISTVGVVEGIRQLTDARTNFRLAVSLHAPDQALRERLIPAARRWPLADLLDALHEHAQTASRDITIEYCLIDGVNASVAQAQTLADLLADLPCKVNLIPLNPVDGVADRPPPAGAIRAFQETLEQRGLTATLRTEKGQDIDAACGQLRARHRA